MKYSFLWYFVNLRVLRGSLIDELLQTGMLQEASTTFIHEVPEASRRKTNKTILQISADVLVSSSEIISSRTPLWPSFVNLRVLRGSINEPFPFEFSAAVQRFEFHELLQAGMSQEASTAFIHEGHEEPRRKTAEKGPRNLVFILSFPQTQ